MVLPYFKKLVFSCLCNRYDRCNILPTRCFTKNSCPRQKKNIHEERLHRQFTTTHIHTCGGRCSVKSEKVCVWRRLGWMDGATGEDIFSHFWEISHFYAKRLSCQNSNRVVYHWLISPRVSQFSPSTLRCLLLCFLCCPFLSSHRVYLNSLSDSCVLFLIWTRIAPVLLSAFCLSFLADILGFRFLDSFRCSALFVVNPPASVSAFGSSFFFWNMMQASRSSVGGNTNLDVVFFSFNKKLYRANVRTNVDINVTNR